MRALFLAATALVFAAGAHAAPSPPTAAAVPAQNAAAPVASQTAAAPARVLPAPKAKAKRARHGKSSRHRPSHPPGRTLTGVLNLNEATAEQLSIFPGLGASRVKAVIAARPYAAAWEVGRVRAVGAKFYRKYEGHLRVDGPTTLGWLAAR